MLASFTKKYEQAISIAKLVAPQKQEIIAELMGKINTYGEFETISLDKLPIVLALVKDLYSRCTEYQAPPRPQPIASAASDKNIPAPRSKTMHPQKVKPTNTAKSTTPTANAKPTCAVQTRQTTANSTTIEAMNLKLQMNCLNKLQELLRKTPTEETMRLTKLYMTVFLDLLVMANQCSHKIRDLIAHTFCFANESYSNGIITQLIKGVQRGVSINYGKLRENLGFIQNKLSENAATVHNDQLSIETIINSMRAELTNLSST